MFSMLTKSSGLAALILAAILSYTAWCLVSASLNLPKVRSSCSWWAILVCSKRHSSFSIWSDRMLIATWQPWRKLGLSLCHFSDGRTDRWTHPLYLMFLLFSMPFRNIFMHLSGWNQELFFQLIHCVLKNMVTDRHYILDSTSLTYLTSAKIQVIIQLTSSSVASFLAASNSLTSSIIPYLSQEFFATICSYLKRKAWKTRLEGFSIDRNSSLVVNMTNRQDISHSAPVRSTPLHCALLRYTPLRYFCEWADPVV